jgi:hypothetical protein
MISLGVNQKGHMFAALYLPANDKARLKGLSTTGMLCLLL